MGIEKSRCSGIEQRERTCRRERLLLRLGRGLWSLRGRGIDHELEALLRRRQLRDVVFRVRATDMLLHGAISFFLRSKSTVSDVFSWSWELWASYAGRGRLTPRQRLRQPEPSWLRSGQTTSLVASAREKDEVRAER